MLKVPGGRTRRPWGFKTKPQEPFNFERYRPKEIDQETVLDWTRNVKLLHQNSSPRQVQHACIQDPRDTQGVKNVACDL